MRFKDTALNNQYINLVGSTPEELLARGIFGSIYYAFKAGYDKRVKPLSYSRNTFVYAAYIAGKETNTVKE